MSRVLQITDKHKRTLGACLGGALLLGGFIQLLIPPTYESHALIYVQKDEGQPSTHAALLSTTAVFQNALASASVRDLPSITKLGDRAIEHLDQRLRTDVTSEGETVTVTYRSGSREASATVLRAVVEAYLAQLRTQEGLGGAAQKMDEALLAGRLAELSSRQASADADARLAANRLIQAASVGDDALTLAALVDTSGADSQELGAAELAYLNTELKKLKQQLASMPSAWGPEHAIRGHIQRRVDAMDYEYDELSTQVAADLRGELERRHTLAVQHAAELAVAIAAAQTTDAQVAKLPVTVFEWPEVPRHQVSPQAGKTLGIAALAGLMLGLVLVVRRELQEQQGRVARIRAAPQASRALLGLEALEDLNTQQGMPLLGQMPEISQAPGTGGVSSDLDDPASSIHQIRAVLQIQATATGERAFAFTSPHRGAGKTSVALGVASSLALSGTRTLVVDCDLAGRIQRSRAAEAGSGAAPVAVRLEDSSASEPADLAHARADGHGQDPRDHSPKGITGMIDGAPLADCVADTTTKGLSLLPAVNPQTAHISKLSDAFVRRVIDESRDAYDMVIFDTGPVPGSVEALLVASQCDGVVVVVKQGEDRKSVDRTLSYLKVVGARITGTVFNRVVTDATANVAGNALTPQAAPAAGQAQVNDPAADRLAGPLAGDQADTPVPADTPAPRKLHGRPLGSGILAAAVFSDAESDDIIEDFELDRSSDFDADLADVFGSIDDGDEEDDEEATT